MNTITRIPSGVKSAPAPTFPSPPHDDDYEAWSLALPGRHYEPSPEDWACLRDEAAASIPGEPSLEDYLADAASYQRSLDSERGADLAGYLDRAAELAALTGAGSLAKMVDRLDAWERCLRESEYDRGHADGDGDGYSLR